MVPNGMIVTIASASTNNSTTVCRPGSIQNASYVTGGDSWVTYCDYSEPEPEEKHPYKFPTITRSRRVKPRPVSGRATHPKDIGYLGRMRCWAREKTDMLPKPIH